MKKTILAVAVSMLAVSGIAELVPELLTLSFYRTNTVASAANDSYFKGTTVRLTNCTAYASNGATQDLTSVGILVSIGDTATNLTVYGTAQVEEDGTFTADALIPGVGGQTMRVQLKLTNAATIYIYPEYTINVWAPL